MNKIYKPIKFFFNLIGILLLLVLVSYILLNLIAPKKTTRIIGFNLYNVSSTSMEPVHKKGDVIFVVKQKSNKYKVGDVITFDTYVKSNNEFININVTHYIAKIVVVDNEYRYYTMTYEHFHEDSPHKYDVWYTKSGEEILYVTPDLVYGKAVLNFGALGKFINKLNALILEPIFYIFIGTMFALLVLIYFFIFGEKIVDKGDANYNYSKRNVVKKKDKKNNNNNKYKAWL